MFNILGWIVFGLLVGLIAKYTHPGEEPVGFFSTLMIGIAGSFIGGVFNYLMTGNTEYRPAGILMSVIGGIVFCAFWRWYSLKQNDK